MGQEKVRVDGTMFEYHTWAGMTLPSTYQGVGEVGLCAFS